MGRKGSNLRSFILEALLEGKYKQYLEWCDFEKKIFIFNLPRVSKYCDFGQLKILQDWYSRKEDVADLKNSVDYSKVKQALQMSLKKSVYFEVQEKKNKFRFLTDDEIEVKRKELNSNKSGIKEENSVKDLINASPFSVASSGYGSFDEDMVFDEMDKLDMDLSNAGSLGDETWKELEKFLYSSNETGEESKRVQLYKIEWEKTVGDGAALGCELSDIYLDLQGPFDKNLSDKPGLFVDKEDLLLKLFCCNVHIVTRIPRCLILLLKQKTEDVVFSKKELKEGNIYEFPHYFVFCSNSKK